MIWLTGSMYLEDTKCSYKSGKKLVGNRWLGSSGHTWEGNNI